MFCEAPHPSLRRWKPAGAGTIPAQYRLLVSFAGPGADREACHQFPGSSRRPALDAIRLARGIRPDSESRAVFGGRFRQLWISTAGFLNRPGVATVRSFVDLVDGCPALRPF